MAATATDPFWATYEGIKEPNFTMMPNEISDVLMPRLSGSQFKVVIWLARKTFGWQQPLTAASISELATATGLSRRTIMNTVADLESFGVILVHREQLDTHTDAINVYALRMADPDKNVLWQSMPRKDAPKHQLPLDLPVHRVGPRRAPEATPDD